MMDGGLFSLLLLKRESTFNVKDFVGTAVHSSRRPAIQIMRSPFLAGKKKERKKTDGPKKKKTRTTFTAYQVFSNEQDSSKTFLSGKSRIFWLLIQTLLLLAIFKMSANKTTLFLFPFNLEFCS